MMFRRYQYDIAISVAEEDVEVAKLINAELQKRKIIYYFYEEQRGDLLGQHLLEITTRIYGKSARYILVITSQHFVRKYWTNLELKAIAAFNKRRDCVLQLRVDNTPVHGLTDFIYMDWNNNPQEIADAIKRKIKRPIILYIVLATAILFAFLFTFSLFYKSPQVKDTGPQVASVQLVEPGYKPKPAKKMLLSSKAMQNNTGVKIPAGAFTMGSDYLNPADGPAHVVNMHSFYISPTEVTIQQYNAYCLAVGKAIPVQQPHRCADSCYPVSNISWDDAKGYCDWVKGRLPTEAEWEYAASGGLQYKYSGGNTAAKVAVYRQDKPSRITLKDSNSLGLYDMSGNVAEWCADWFDADYYKTNPSDNPTGPAKGTEKVVRGGAYDSEVYDLPVVLRHKALPTTKSPAIGFRVVWNDK